MATKWRNAAGETCGALRKSGRFRPDSLPAEFRRCSQVYPRTRRRVRKSPGILRQLSGANASLAGDDAAASRIRSQKKYAACGARRRKGNIPERVSIFKGLNLRAPAVRDMGGEIWREGAFVFPDYPPARCCVHAPSLCGREGVAGNREVRKATSVVCGREARQFFSRD